MQDILPGMPHLPRQPEAASCVVLCGDGAVLYAGWSITLAELPEKRTPCVLRLCVAEHKVNAVLWPFVLAGTVLLLREPHCWRHLNASLSHCSCVAKYLCLPAGWGKSLCYQMPALLLGGTTLVVSPLLALMRDQLQRLPPQLPAGMLWGGQSKQEALQVLGELRVSLTGV